ncbi:hypothetical protein P3X46_010923 [Hevea brasiliensis]|uniref:RING-type E3 ubiquitin transferase n=1 Tax=Hevea brasiliensis TaxID=3981 RepID=A0ABQ9MFK4_HEVBR|nr:hypothetical protein P3X46_010923 [Hevea brasiliensis]
MWPGHAQRSISFQGAYTESKKKWEKESCLSGSTMLLSRESESSDPWEWVKDDQILLVLHHPMSFTLTNRVIKGEIRSLNSKSNLKYFDAVRILSQVSNLYFVSILDTMVDGGIDIYKGTGFCEILGQITGGGAGPFTIVPNWRCDSADDFCSKLATDGSFKGVKLFTQNVKCEQMPAQGNVTVPPMENQFIMAVRSGPNKMTVAAEGVWKSSSGLLCMVGCLGLVDTERSSCNSCICLYIPMSFSIKQRSIVYGSFFSAAKINASYFPSSFEKLVWPTELWNYFRNFRPYCSCSKIEKAIFITVLKKSLLQSPKLEDTEACITILSLLAGDLTLHTSAFPDPFPSSRPTRIDFQMEILSLGPMFGCLEQFSVLFLEGLYDLHVGTVYLVGCRDVQASWNILFDSIDLESVNPAARISISSQCNGDDPLHFGTLRLQTLPIMYRRRQREHILSRRGIEGILQILTVSFAIGCILSQLFYIKQDADSLGYGLPLITGAEALFKRMSFESYETSSYDLEKNRWVHLFDYTAKILAMVSFLLTIRLCQKVDKRVFLCTLTIHVIGCVIVLIVHSLKTSRNLSKWRNMLILLVIPGLCENGKLNFEHVGLVRDFFLLPQIMWLIDLKPLKELSRFQNICPNTFVRNLPHVYDYIRASVPNPYFAGEYEFQRWNYEKLSQSLTAGQYRLLPKGFRVYQRLLSKSFEAELASGVNEDAVATERDDEE